MMNKQNQHILLKAIFVVLVLNLSGCFVPVTDVDNLSPKKTQLLLIKKLSNYKVDIIVQKKDTVTFVLPASKEFFNSGSANLAEDTYDVLNILYSLINCYGEVNVSVIGFGPQDSNDGSDRVLAFERACRVSKYLWNLGVNVSFIYADVGKKLKNEKVFFSNCVVINLEVLKKGI